MTIRTITTEAGEFPLHEYRLGLAGRTWSILHTHAMLTLDDEAHFFQQLRNQVPYGVALWPAAIALAHELAGRGPALAGRSLLELGAGTGLPGLVAAAFGAQVRQTDRHDLARAIGLRNAARNAADVRYDLADWASWDDPARYDYIVGADILYAEQLHPQLELILAANLAPGGRALLADPFRRASLGLLERLEAAGWAIALSKWAIGADDAPRPVGVYELAPPA